jgi:hypothetical protein
MLVIITGGEEDLDLKTEMKLQDVYCVATRIIKQRTVGI